MALFNTVNIFLEKMSGLSPAYLSVYHSLVCVCARARACVRSRVTVKTMSCDLILPLEVTECDVTARRPYVLLVGLQMT